jgi:hypothetical protein
VYAVADDDGYGSHLLRLGDDGNCEAWEIRGDLDQLATLAEAIRDAVAHPRPMYTAGWNVSGYLPETAPQHFDTFAEAIAYLAENVEVFWDHDSDGDIAADLRWQELREELHNATPAEGTFLACTGDGHLAFWIEPTGWIEPTD